MVSRRSPGHEQARAEAVHDDVELAWEAQGGRETSPRPRAWLRAFGWGPASAAPRRPLPGGRFDNRGVGESGKPPGPYTTPRWRRCRGRARGRRVERAHVVGTSLGGMIAQELALPTRIASRRSSSARPRPEANGPSRHPSNRRALRGFADDPSGATPPSGRERTLKEHRADRGRGSSTRSIATGSSIPRAGWRGSPRPRPAAPSRRWPRFPG